MNTDTKTDSPTNPRISAAEQIEDWLNAGCTIQAMRPGKAKVSDDEISGLLVTGHPDDLKPVEAPAAQESKATHSKVYDTGSARWTHGEITSWHPNRAPERWLLGPCPQCGSSTSNYGTAYRCNRAYCPNNNFVCGPDPMPEWWNTDINVKKDGDKWCATRDGFVNLQESLAGFGDTPNDAVEELKRSESAAQEKCPTCGCPKGKILLGICNDPWHPSEDNPQPPQDKCPHCDFVGDICPQHNRMGRVPIEVKRAIEEDQKAEKPPQEKWEPRFKVGDRVTVTSGWPTYRGSVLEIAEIVEAYKGYKMAGLHHSQIFGESQLQAFSWSLPTPPAGQQWHRSDWTQDLLPEGWRPLLSGEQRQEGDETLCPLNGRFEKVQGVGYTAGKENAHLRTRRHLPPTQPATAKTGTIGDMRATFEAAMLRNGFFSLPDSWNEKAKCYNHTHQAMWVAWQSAIAFASSAETQGVPSVEELIEVYRDSKEDPSIFVPAYERIKQGISAVREACMAHFKGLIYQARLANDRCANAMFDKEQAINREAEAIGRAVSAEKTADALRREVETITADRDTLESYYQKVTKVALDCSPIPASQRPDNQIEPPWEVFARMKAERDAAKGALEFAMQKTDEFRQWLTGKR